MFTVELKFKIAEREVSLEKFGDALVGKILEQLTGEIRRIQIPVVAPSSLPKQEPKSKARAVGINQAAEMIGLSPATIRKYVAERRLFSVRAGRRILIPMETIDQVMAEGFPPNGRP
jgi:excisionase family DNA binding protein